VARDVQVAQRRNRPHNRQSVLVVDDDRDAGEMLSEYLAFCGFVVHRAHDGSEAIDVAVRERPCVVLMDLMMPRMDGWEATRRLKTNERTNGIPIVAVSACSHGDDQAWACGVGFDDFVPKPVNLHHIAGLVRRYCRSSAAGVRRTLNGAALRARRS
jgi:two-component system cell cycle response regulator DivK